MLRTGVGPRKRGRGGRIGNGLTGDAAAHLIDLMIEQRERGEKRGKGK